jgi:hypothetical protein
MVTNPVRFHWCSYGLVERSILDAGGSADSRGVERLPFASEVANHQDQPLLLCRLQW